jgi:hypothetical protein
MAVSFARPSPEEQMWLAHPQLKIGEPSCLVERFHSPSLQGEISAGKTVLEDLPGPHPFPVVKTDQYEALGNAVHAYLAALPSLIGAIESWKEEVALRCLKTFEAESLIIPKALVACGVRLETWVRQKGGGTWMTEVPVSAPRAAGGQWHGTIDLMIELEEGQVLLVDHKSRPIPAGMAAKAALEFAGQLNAYREILEQQGLSVMGSWIHFPMAGVMAMVE